MRRVSGPRGGDRRVRSRWPPLNPLQFLFAVMAFAVVMFFLMILWMQSLTGSGAPPDLRRSSRIGSLPPGNMLRFKPTDLLRRFDERGGLDRLRLEPRPHGIRAPRLALVTGRINDDPHSLMLLTLVKGLRELGYIFTVFALQNEEAHSLWEHVGCQVFILSSGTSASVDWSNYEGVILNSLEAKQVISSLMQEPFNDVPVIWLVEEDTLGNRLSSYVASGWQHLIAAWRTAFSRADVVVFPDFSLPMLYTSLDCGNFYVVSGSPVDVWAAMSSITSHSRYDLRNENGFNEDDFIVLVIGSNLFDNAFAVMSALFKENTSIKQLGGTIKYVFLWGNFTEANDSDFQEIASHMGFPDGSMRRYGMDGDVNNLILMADIVLYGSFLEEQSFPPLLVRAMSFEIPIVVPDLAIIKKYVVENVHAVIFNHTQPDSLAGAFLRLIENKNLSTEARAIASNGKFLSKNMLASDCITEYAKLLEHVLQFPSDVRLPDSISQIQQNTWLWSILEDLKDSDIEQGSSIVDILEEQLTNNSRINNTAMDEIDHVTQDYPTQLDWNDVIEMEISEDLLRREIQEQEERMERDSGSWEDIYRNARKAEKTIVDPIGHDESELERIGRLLCIYEIYNGEGSWPFLHHGALYRGISLSRKVPKTRPDDVNAVGRLPILGTTYYRDLLCDFGALFSIAKKVDSIHRTPWIGFQSWHAAGRKVSLSPRAEKVVEQAIQAESKGDVFFYWASSDFDQKDEGKSQTHHFWSMCDILNAGHCRYAFKEAFGRMYGLPAAFSVLPPMPSDGGKWSTLHSWVMPTPSFLEFVMFSRMFVDSLHSTNQERGNSSNPTSCVLGSSQTQKKQCYRRLLELLVNVWAYHSRRRMVYVDPESGDLAEQHPVARREGTMWVKYFDFSLLKSMDEDLAEEADDYGMMMHHPTSKRLWPLTGEVHWQGILDREREDRYRRKLDKKRKTKEKLLERHKHGYKQKPI